uniref:EXPERA domain-containing protein n=1 Tax=Arcella intermedia TaxID=1963864 RepID=A0A6B2LGB4_9EUKA
MFQVYQIAVGWVVFGTLFSIYLHYTTHGIWNTPSMLLSFFLWLNGLICLWEVCLFFKIQHIYQIYLKWKKQYGGREYQAVKELAFMKVSLKGIFDPHTWGHIWATYSVYDPSYANKESFGFFIDVGNGFTTLIPSFLFLFNMTFNILSGRILGIVGLMSFYQEWYGTIIYWLSYIVNHRYRNFGFAQIFFFVACTNALWFIFPLYGIYVSIHLILHDDLSIFHTPQPIFFH